jgi:hypothetical protein
VSNLYTAFERKNFARKAVELLESVEDGGFTGDVEVVLLTASIYVELAKEM